MLGHRGRPVATTADGSLVLRDEPGGLFFSATIDSGDLEVGEYLDGLRAWGPALPNSIAAYHDQIEKAFDAAAVPWRITSGAPRLLISPPCRPIRQQPSAVVGSASHPGPDDPKRTISRNFQDRGSRGTKHADRS